MATKSLIALLSCTLCLGSMSALADVTKMCNDHQQKKCTRFCMKHKGMKSCMLDMTSKSGMCTCVDGTMHMKKK